MSSDATTNRPRPRPGPTVAAEVAPTPSDAQVPDGVPGPGRGRWSWWLVVAVAAVAVLAAAGWLVHLENRAPVKSIRPSVGDSGTYTPGSLASSDDAAAVRAAVAYLPSVLGYDYRSLDAGLKAAQAHLTPEFSTTFTNTFNDSVRPVAVKNKAVVKTLVRAAGIVNRSGDTATVLAFVDQALVSGTSADSGTGSGATTAAGPKISQDRVRVSLIRSGGKWLITAVDGF